MSILSKRPNWRGFCSDVLKTALSQGRHGTVKDRMRSGSPVMKWHNLDEKDRREIKRILQERQTTGQTSADPDTIPRAMKKHVAKWEAEERQRQDAENFLADLDGKPSVNQYGFALDEDANIIDDGS